MFKLSAFCDDKHLPAVMRALVGLVSDLAVVPVVNALPPAVPGGALREVPGGTIGFVRNEVMQFDSFTVINVREMLQRVGQSPASAQYYINDLVKHGVVRRTAKRGASNAVIYTTRKAAPKKARKGPEPLVKLAKAEGNG